MENTRLKILAIDDNSDNLLSMKALLNEMFANAIVFTARDGLNGIKIAKQEDPSVILLDILMPGMDGFQVCSKIKKDKMLLNIPVVFVTALDTDRETRVKAIEVGAEGFLTKPINELELMAQIKAMVKIKNANLDRRTEKERLNILVQERTKELERELEKRTKTEVTLRDLNIKFQQNQFALMNLMEDMQDEIENRKRLEKDIASSLENEKRRTNELELLLEGAKGILQDSHFQITAKRHFDLIKKLTGAASGYIAFISKSISKEQIVLCRAENVLLLDSSESSISFQDARIQILNTKKAMDENDFLNSQWGKELLKEEMHLQNVLYSPIIINNVAIGVICLINKPGDFDSNDIRIVEAFVNLTALAFDNRKSREKLIESEEQFRATIQQSNDGIIIADSMLKIITWNTAQSQIFGYLPEEMIGKTIWDFQFMSLPEENRSDEMYRFIQNKWLKGMEKSKEEKDEFLSVIKEIDIQTKDNLRKTIQVSSFAIHLPGETLYGSFTRDVTEQKYSEKMKDHFINMVSHELRTPLASIKEGICILSQLGLNTVSEDCSYLLEVCKNNTERLCNFVNDVLDFQKLKDNTFFINTTKVNIEKVLNDVYKMMVLPAKEKKLHLILDVPKNLPLFECDSDKIFRLVTNLVGNSIKYTEKGSVSITCNYLQKKNSILITVSDTGIGIHQDDLKKLFTSFSQVTSKNYSRPGSSGLGLAISKEIVDKHHGEIWVESVPDEGTSVFVQLPLQQ